MTLQERIAKVIKAKLELGDIPMADDVIAEAAAAAIAELKAFIADA